MEQRQNELPICRPIISSHDDGQDHGRVESRRARRLSDPGSPVSHSSAVLDTSSSTTTTMSSSARDVDPQREQQRHVDEIMEGEEMRRSHVVSGGGVRHHHHHHPRAVTLSEPNTVRRMTVQPLHQRAVTPSLAVHDDDVDEDNNDDVAPTREEGNRGADTVTFSGGRSSAVAGRSGNRSVSFSLTAAESEEDGDGDDDMCRLSSSRGRTAGAGAEVETVATVT